MGAIDTSWLYTDADKRYQWMLRMSIIAFIAGIAAFVTANLWTETGSRIALWTAAFTAGLTIVTLLSLYGLTTAPQFKRIRNSL